MNILVTGANGQLGNEMRLVARESSDRYIFTDVVELDITDAAAVEKTVAENDIRLIVNCAAYTNVDKAEDDREQAERLNVRAVENLARAVKKQDGWLFHISTDYVFGREPYNTPCREEQQGTPTGVYGETKLRGEQVIRESGCHHVIIRTAWLYSEFGRNFLKTMLELTATRPQLQVVFDQTGTPTYALDLAETIFDIVEHRKYEGHEGIYHYSNEGVCSWYDFTKAIAKFAGHTECDIRPCHSDEFPSKVRRPAYSVLDKTKIKETFGIRIPYWTDSLEKCLENLKRNGL
ncbi:MAG: dTDP-4-dehydrorhamnose reductase [Alistipes senegalensis]|nr:dTDP-4-dehydrorhamnose reductase [Bacteroides cellulosilyticus]MCM1352539.1 dTDP-4-dehydrorhamnose reductase [Alistipes senegalensis]